MMSIENVNTVNSYNDYYVQPKKTCTNRIGMTSIGLASAGAAINYLLHEDAKVDVLWPHCEKNGSRRWTKKIDAPFKQKYNLENFLSENSTGVKWVDKKLTGRKAAIAAKYLPLAAISLAFVLGCFGLGAAMDNSKYNRKIKKAQKRALKLQEQALNLQMKQKVINAQV